MIDAAYATSSLLASQYKLQGGSQTVAGLLKPGGAEAFSSAELLKNALANAGANASQQALAGFIQENVPNSGKLLKDLQAVLALQEMDTEYASTADFLNPYTKALGLAGLNTPQPNANAALVSLIS